VTTGEVEGLLRALAPQALAALVRRYGDFGTAEDAVQEALLAAALQWPDQGVPDSPRGWLIAVAARRLIDWRRRESARRGKEAAAVDFVPADSAALPGPGDEPVPDHDDTLTLLFLCCHPALAGPAQVALTLRAVGGLTTAEIAAAFLVPEATMAQRIVRAKQRIRATGIPFAMPEPEQLPARLASVLRVVYLIFNEGYATTSGPTLARADLTGEAIRLARELHRLRPGEGEVTGLLALMLLTEARREGRTRDGALVPLLEQDRNAWDTTLIAEGSALVDTALRTAPIGPYQIQAAIAALHTGAHDPAATDWPQILALYDLLDRLAPSPVVTLNRAVATAMVHGPRAGLALLDGLAGEPRLAGGHRLAAVRAHLLEMDGQLDDALVWYRRAAATTTSLPEREYLLGRAARHDPARPGGAGAGRGSATQTEVE
jgi:predicted RNA polymerase sigma factor